MYASARDFVHGMTEYVPPGVPSLLSLALKLRCDACAAFSERANSCSSPSCSSGSVVFPLISSLYDFSFSPCCNWVEQRDVENRRDVIEARCHGGALYRKREGWSEDCGVGRRDNCDQVAIDCSHNSVGCVRQDVVGLPGLFRGKT